MATAQNLKAKEESREGFMKELEQMRKFAQDLSDENEKLRFILEEKEKVIADLAKKRNDEPIGFVIPQPELNKKAKPALEIEIFEPRHSNTVELDMFRGKI